MTKRGRGIDICNVKSPCKNCKNRFVGCHSQCESYKLYRENNEKRYSDHLEEKKIRDDYRELRGTSYCRNVRPKDRKLSSLYWG